MASARISRLLEKTIDLDKDERYMATSDLCTEFQKEQHLMLDHHLESRVCSAILKQLDDTSNDVQSIAVKCLGILATKVREPQVGDICQRVCELILKGKADLRDIYAIGLKTLIQDIPESMGQSIAPPVCTRLLSGIKSDEKTDQDMNLECLEILTDLLKRFGYCVRSEHEAIASIVSLKLRHQSSVIRKRSTNCLGALASFANEALLNSLIQQLLKNIQADTYVETSIQAIGTFSRTVGHRLGIHLDEIIPLFLQFCGNKNDDMHEEEASNEMRESCFHGFESFILRCPREITKHINDILSTALAFMTFDPNYTYDTSGGEMEEDLDGDDELYSDDDELDDFSDDDDTSWKVRRSALKVLTAIITSRPQMLGELYKKAAGPLIERFKEREENVRVDIVASFTSLVHATRPSSDSGQNHRLEKQECIDVLKSLVPDILTAATKPVHFGVKAPVKTKCAFYKLFLTIAQVAPGAFEHHASFLFPHNVESSLADRNSSLKYDALVFTKVFLKTHPSNTIQEHLATLVPVVIKCVEEEWYKIIAEALAVLGAIVQAMRPPTSSKFDFEPFVKPIYDSISSRLFAFDIDQEIKEHAISSMGILLATMGDKLSTEMAHVLPLLMDRLSNEITRAAALKALMLVAQSPLKLDLSLILKEATITLSQFLKQKNRMLKQTTLETLNALTTSSTSMNGELFTTITNAASALMTDADLHLAHLATKLVTSILTSTNADISESAKNDSITAALALSHSPLLQGPALKSLMEFFQTLLGTNVCEFTDLMEKLVKPICDKKSSMEMMDDGHTTHDLIPLHAITNTANCVAAMCSCKSTCSDDVSKTLERFVSDIKNESASTEDVKVLALLSIGEIGRKTDLSAFPNVQQVILESLNSGVEETKSAASNALGYACVGNMKTYLPLILDLMAKNDLKNQYLVLNSLKEVIVYHVNTPALDFSPYVSQVLPILNSHCESQEEGVRSMVAECLGRLALVDPSTVLPQLISACDPSTSLFTRWTAVTALKFCMMDRETVMTHLPASLQKFLEALKDEDISVRRAALMTLNSAVHHQPQLIKDHFESLIFSELKKTMELKLERIVDLGPFKHKVDDALLIRKAAFSVVDTVLHTIPEKLDVASFLPYLKLGLSDSDNDVQLLTVQIVMKLSSLYPATILNSVEKYLLPSLDKAVNRKQKENQVATEVDRANDLIRNILRAVYEIHCINGSVHVKAFQEFWERINKKEKLRLMIEGIQKEREQI